MTDDPVINKLLLEGAKALTEYKHKQFTRGKSMNEDLWKHRSQSMRCKTCIFFVLKKSCCVEQIPAEAEQKESVPLGRCRRHAPTMGGYPAVFVNDWCGDHKVDENKL